MSKPGRPRKTELRSQVKSKAAVEDKSSSSDDTTVKATFYLTQEAVDTLEEAWHNLRRSASGSERGAITKSLIVRLALEIAFEEMRQKGAASQLLRRVADR